MKRHNCRMTPEEREQHERATKIRKMTDQQLCTYIDELREKNVIPAEIPDIGKVRRQSVEDFLSDVQNCCKGVGQATIAKLRGFAKANGDIS